MSTCPSLGVAPGNPHEQLSLDADDAVRRQIFPNRAVWFGRWAARVGQRAALPDAGKEEETGAWQRPLMDAGPAGPIPL